MKRIIPFIFILLATTASAQGWRQTLNGLLSPAAVLQSPDGGAVILANSIPSGPQGRQIVLSKTDQDGRLQWQQSFGAPSDDEGRSMVMTADGHIAVAGKMSFVTNNGDAFLALFDLAGQKIWERNYNFGVLDDARCMRQMPDGGFALAIEADNQLRLLRTDSEGDEIWSAPFPQTAGLSVKHLEIRQDSGFVVTLLRNTLPIGAPAAVVVQISPAGNIETQLTLPHFSSFITTDQVRCKPASDSTFWLMHRDSVYLLDRDTTVLRQWQLEAPADLYLTDLIPAEDGGFFALGTNFSFAGTAFSRAYFARFQADGTEVWARYYDAPSTLHSAWSAVRTQDGGFFLTGNYAKNGAYFSYLLRTDSLGQAFANKISGQVFWDKNSNCERDNNEPALAGWLLKVERTNGDLHYTNTDANGLYEIEAGVGEHRVSVVVPNGIWGAECMDIGEVVFDAPFQSFLLDFPINNIAACPLPRVDAGVDYWVRCAENTFLVRYVNAGSVVAEAASVTLELDSLLTLTDAALPFTQISAHTWRFPVGDLQPLADSSFWVKIQADCNVETLGRTLCVTAHIEPDDPCLSPIVGPLLVVEGHCDGDSVRFDVINLGAPMNESLPYIVVEDNVMFLQNEALQLDAGQSWTLSVPANGATWRFEVLQAPGTAEWLGDSRAAAVVEACSASGSFSTGFVNQFSLYDGGYFTETECRPVVGDAQGQQKVAYPTGWQAEHLVEPNTDLEYALHYQHTGGSSLGGLSLRDTLDHTLLDPSSVQPGPASHPYQFEMSGAGVLTFRFMGFVLEDSARAWVKFRVAQRPDLPLGTVIRNRAWAYPGFAAPIQTNEIFHTLGPPLISGGGGNPDPSAAEFRVWPVPTVAGLTVTMADPGEYVCQLADLAGRVILEQAFSGTSLTFEEHELPVGTFTATVTAKGRRIGTARVVKFSR